MTVFAPDPTDVSRWWEEGGYDVRRAAEIACAEIESRATEGDAASEAMLREWTVSGARQHLKRVFAALNQRFVPANGHAAVRVPGALSIKREDGSRQMVLFEVMTRAEFELAVAEYRAQADKRLRTLDVFDQVLSTWDAQPEIANVRDAFAAAGIDLEQAVAEAFA
jgi:hypothetical protein